MEKNKLSNNQTNKTNNYNQIGKPTLVESIISKVKDNENKNLRMYLTFVIPIIVLLCYLVYKYSFSSRSVDAVTKMNYKPQLSLKPLSECYNIDIKQQYKLCDYYISSSFMTPCIGNQHYDYVSNDMITEVIQSGARYIQIPICEADVSLESLPVIGTAVYGERIITSLNTLEIRSVLKVIRANAFKINNKAMNYPLIVHLILNTNNAFTLSNVYDNIIEVFGDVLLDASKYKDIPVFLEKLCNLQGKIILFSTPEYIGTKLEPVIVHTSKLFEIYHFSDLGPLNMPTDTLYKNQYNKKLSNKEQHKSNKKFKEKYPSIDYIINNAHNIGDTILNDTEILNNLSSFNKVGMSLVKPHYYEDVISKNYNFEESVYYGCQFTTMNFQVNDINMQNYLSMFLDSSFRLKPDSLRFTEKEEPIQDLLKLYNSVSQKNDNIINNFYYKYSNSLIALESYTLQNTFLSQIETNLRFNLGTNQIKDKYGNITYKININQCFLIKKSSVSTGNNISVYLESASKPGFFVTMNTNFFDLEELSSNKKKLLNQAFFIENPKTIDNETEDEMISIKTTTDDNPMFIAFENKIPKAYADIPTSEAQNNMTFKVHNIQFKYIIKFVTIFDGSIKTMGGNILGVLENNTTDGTAYYVIPMNQTSSGDNGSNTNNFNIFKNQFILQNKAKKTYVVFDPETLFLYDREKTPNRNGIFNIESLNGYFTIKNTNNDNLIVVNKNLLKFGKEKNIVSNENLFMLDISYELL